jgi:hypothetical protein
VEINLETGLQVFMFIVAFGGMYAALIRDSA